MLKKIPKIFLEFNLNKIISLEPAQAGLLPVGVKKGCRPPSNYNLIYLCV